MNANDFKIHDIRDFPVCVIEPGVVVPGYSRQWEREIDALVTRGEPFVLIYREPGDDEPHEDRKARAVWLKQNKGRFAGLCLGIISVLADAARRAHFDGMRKMGEQAFGVRYRTAATLEEGVVLAGRLLDDTKL